MAATTATIAPATIPIRVIAITPLTEDIRLFRVERCDDQPFHFVAGAWMQWQIPGPDGNLLKRCFSAASAPDGSAQMDFIIRRTPNGAGTKWLFEECTVGTTLNLFGPSGRFRLQDTPAPTIMVAGGSGLSAIRSIIMDMQAKHSHRQVRLFFGAVNRSQLYLVDELQALEKSLTDFKFIPALSQPAPEDNWDGATGLITQVLDQYLQGSPMANGEAYLCGSPGMLNACCQVLNDHGIDNSRIFFDKFLSPPK